MDEISSCSVFSQSLGIFSLLNFSCSSSYITLWWFSCGSYIVLLYGGFILHYLMTKGRSQLFIYVHVFSLLKCLLKPLLFEVIV